MILVVQLGQRDFATQVLQRMLHLFWRVNQKKTFAQTYAADFQLYSHHKTFLSHPSRNLKVIFTLLESTQFT